MGLIGRAPAATGDINKTPASRRASSASRSGRSQRLRSSVHRGGEEVQPELVVEAGNVEDCPALLRPFTNDPPVHPESDLHALVARGQAEPRPHVVAFDAPHRCAVVALARGHLGVQSAVGERRAEGLQDVRAVVPGSPREAHAPRAIEGEIGVPPAVHVPADVHPVRQQAALRHPASGGCVAAASQDREGGRHAVVGAGRKHEPVLEARWRRRQRRVARPVGKVWPIDHHKVVGDEPPGEAVAVRRDPVEVADPHLDPPLRRGHPEQFSTPVQGPVGRRRRAHVVPEEQHLREEL
mmetsp:Transcript_40723/g.106026  ORF Transcript_40723/g.106026 Transcript_40723/m.106026 type:complete len:296 (-) Transcript_40723:139-1026(-)